MTTPDLLLADRIASHGARTAIADADGALGYRQLDESSAAVAAALLGDRTDLEGRRVAFLVTPARGYVSVLLGIWRAGGVAVPLAVSHPVPELEYVVLDAGAAVIVTDEPCRGMAATVSAATGVPLVAVDRLGAGSVRSLPTIDPRRRALMLYTSGTTGRPKGVVTTHANVQAQVQSLVEAWGWTANDRTLLVLPLHHVHGLINVVSSALWSGAVCEMLPRFDEGATWARLASGELTVFTAVPTIYYRLIEAWEKDPDAQAGRAAGAGRLRLMMSGSAALPVGILERWKAITGHVLLERYGMTEIGMALSNPLLGERRPGCVGAPLPGVEIRLLDEAGAPVPEDSPGEIEVRGPGVFLEYWRRPAETAAAFRDGWFRTGDIATLDRGAYRLLGRASVDIIKTGGFKVSALEIEDALRQHPAVGDCAVVGVEDPEWGERISAAVQPRAGRMPEVDPDELRAWLGDRLAPYKLPRSYVVVDALPRNAMGKVVKTAVARLFQAPGR